MTVRKSTFRTRSIQGTIKNSPGPFAPPGRIRPRRKITARSYSAITCIVGNVYITTLKIRARNTIVYRDGEENLVFNPYGRREINFLDCSLHLRISCKIRPKLHVASKNRKASVADKKLHRQLINITGYSTTSILA